MTNDLDHGASVLANGLYDVAECDIACIVTSLQMLQPPRREFAAQRGDWDLSEWQDVTADTYRDLYRAIGQDWLWTSRLYLSDKELTGILHDPQVMLYHLQGPAGQGLLELDFRQPDICELAFLGLTAGLIGSGAGSWLMERAIDFAWSRPIQRFWVHTCTLDHPNAVAFYQRSGFQAFRRQVEIMPDPRLNGTLPKGSAPHIPDLMS